LIKVLTLVAGCVFYGLFAGRVLCFPDYSSIMPESLVFRLPSECVICYIFGFWHYISRAVFLRPTK